MKGQDVYYIKIEKGGAEFDSTVSKLFSVGFVFGNDRYRNLKIIHDTWSCSYSTWNVLTIGEQECRAIIHARSFRIYSDFKGFTSLDEILKLVALDLY